ncbi:MAG TPA: hypothetical protein VFN26_22320 [Candidatus Acidoferrum sp.]|nr:hypothetical protein [Candidatus Acidoferrum sp.]
MFVRFDGSADHLRKYLPDFVSLIGNEIWRKRLTQLLQNLNQSPALAHIVFHYHWLELALDEQLAISERNSSDYEEAFVPESLSALHFAQTVVEVHTRLSAPGQISLRGRLRDSLKAENGFASLYLEIDLARRLFEAGFEVEFADLEGLARYDLRFWKGDITGELECKSISADAGRQIHRKDFYRFIDALEPQIIDGTRMNYGILLVTLQERLPSDVERQRILRDAAKHMLRDPSAPIMRGTFFVIERRKFEELTGTTQISGVEELYRQCRDAFGENCHVSGATGPQTNCLVVMRSVREDDHSKPIYRALKDAERQFSSKQPSFIFLQFDDIEPRDLLSRHLRRRMGILSYAFFYKRQPSHVAAVCCCAYNGLISSPNGVCVPAIATPNPKPKFPIIPSEYPLFLGHIPDAEFAAILQAPPPVENLSYIEFEPEAMAKKNVETEEST